MNDVKMFSNKNSIKNHDFLIFELLIVELCNMTCSYCYMRNDSPSWGKFSTKKQVYEVIYQLEQIDNKTSICLSGGEASLHPNFLEFVEYIANSKDIFELHINTNLQMSMKTIQKILEIDPNVKFHISWHSGAKEDFFDKILRIPQKNQELNVMVHPARKYGEDIKNITDKCRNNNILFNVKPVFVNSTFKPTKHVINTLDIEGANKEYTDGINDYNDYDLYSNDLLPMDTYGWDCYYIFYTIDCRQGNIKQMCVLYDELNIFKDHKFFSDYDLSKPVTCPFKNKCLWASSLDHLKYKRN